MPEEEQGPISERDQAMFYADAMHRLHDAITDVIEAIAPRITNEGEQDFAVGVVPPNLRLAEFTLVTSWVDMDTGRPYLEIDSSSQSAHSRTGMLLTALDRSRTLGLGA